MADALALEADGANFNADGKQAVYTLYGSGGFRLYQIYKIYPHGTGQPEAA